MDSRASSHGGEEAQAHSIWHMEFEHPPRLRLRESLVNCGPNYILDTLLAEVLERGDGQTEYLDLSMPVVRTFVGGDEKRSVVCSDCSRELRSASRLYSPVALAAAPDGSLFIGDHNLIRRVSRQGTHVDTVLELRYPAWNTYWHLPTAV